MFSSKHEIWKFAYSWDELDDWLPYAEDLVRSWTNQSAEEIKFRSRFEIVIASFLLMDDLLPLAAKKAFAALTLDVISEADKKKLTIESLRIHPPPPGRKRDKRAIFSRNWAVIELLEKGHQKQEAYEMVANQFHKSPDTIRRDYERYYQRRKKRDDGEIE